MRSKNDKGISQLIYKMLVARNGVHPKKPKKTLATKQKTYPKPKFISLKKKEKETAISHMYNRTRRIWFKTWIF